MTILDLADLVSAPGAPVPQARRCAPAPPAAALIRQIEAIDAWNTARHARESLLHAGCRSRLDKEAARREGQALQRTHEAIAACAADALRANTWPMRPPAATAVVAHRHEWFAHRVTLLLEGQGVAVVMCTDNGAEALGAVVAEQPDILLAGDRLAMMPGDRLLADARLFAPFTHRALQTSNPQQAGAWREEADSVFLRHHTPGHVADALGALCAGARAL